MSKMTLKDLDIKGKRVLMRVDFNVPIEKGKIGDDTRIRACLPSIEYILKHGAALILMSHLGRPRGKEASLSLKPCADRLSELLHVPIKMAPDSIGGDVEKEAADLKPGQILLLENLRFHEGEENPDKDPSFAQKLSKLGDCYVNDAFGTAHRAHASTATIAQFFPGKSAMGFLLENEIDHLTPLLQKPDRPFYAIIGGSKISTKIGVIRKLLNLVDELFIGGGMTFTFLKAQGIPIGDSISEDSSLVKGIDRKKIHLPLDLVIADAINENGKTKIIPIDQGIPTGWQGVDIGPKTVETWGKEFQNAATLFWNGPVGVFEISPFASGTRGVAEAIAQSKAKSFIGGGDSVAAVEQMGLAKKFTFLSTGGGASLEFLEFGHLPGIEALSEG